MSVPRAPSAGELEAPRASTTDEGAIEEEKETRARMDSMRSSSSSSLMLTRIITRARTPSRSELEAMLRAVDEKRARESGGAREYSNRGELAGRARVELRDGDVYRGPWSGRAPAGFGRYSWGNGNEYAGEFLEGVPSGTGTYEWARGGVYKGEFERGTMNGKGTYTSSNGAEYRGSWKDGKKHGLGVQVFENGDTYEGMWNSGKAHGPGTYRWAARAEQQGQDEFDGEWVQGKMHGWGTLRWATGDRYDGNWSEGEISGNGILSWHDGSSFTGHWKNGRMDGTGAFVMPPAKSKHDKESRNVLRISMKRSPKPKTSFDDFDNEDTSEAMGTYVLLCECVDNELVKQEVVEAERVRGHKHSLWMRPTASRSQKVRKVLHGETIYKGHGSYDLMLQLRVGIRWSVGTTQNAANAPLSVASFETTIKQVFPRSGSTVTPPHFARTFKWKEYRPEVFQKLRTHWNVERADFLLSLCGDQALRELASPGKSGSVFYLSHDDKFIIKTMRKSEMANLKAWLHLYYLHVHEYPESLLPKFFGLYSIKIPGGKKVRVVVMANLFASKYVNHKTFDLKGSTHGRFTKEGKEDSQTVLKDLDIASKFRVEEGKRDKLLKQLQVDCAFLQSVRVMDYSLLVGVHILPPSPGTEDEPTSPASDGTNESASPWGGAEWREQAIRSVRENLKALDLYNSRKEFGFGHGTASSSEARLRPPPGTDDLIAHSNGKKAVLGVAMSAVSVHDRAVDKAHPMKSPLDEYHEPHDVILHLGIIDVLQEYTTSKSLETTMMTMMGKQSFSSVDPAAYAKRFLRLMNRLFE